MPRSGKETKEIFEEWISWLEKERRLSNHTVISYNNDAEAFFQFMTNHFGGEINAGILTEMTLRDFRSWLAYRTTQEYNFSSTARAISAVKSFFRYIDKFHNIKNTAVFNLQAPKQDKPLPKALEQSQTEKAVDIIGEFQSEEWVAKRDSALLTLIYGAGLRISEALSLTKGDFKKDDYIIVKGKGSKERRVPLLPIIKEAINDYIENCPYEIGNNDTLFIGKRRRQAQSCCIPASSESYEKSPWPP